MKTVALYALLLFYSLSLWARNTVSMIPEKGKGPSTNHKTKLNILHIHADDFKADALHLLGNKDVHTPNLDKLVEKGFHFSRAYTMGSMIGAVCLPSRTMMLTGRSWLRIPGQKAAADNASDSNTFLPKVMEHTGYQTWHYGKGGNEFTAGVKAFQTNIIDEARGQQRAESSKNLADKTIEFLKTRSNNKESSPFYIYLAPPVPHDPRIAETKFHEMYQADTIKLSPSFMPLHPFDNGDMKVRDETLAPWPRTAQDTKKQLAEYYACITGLDYHIGRIFDALKESNQWENTIIIFSGDNGLSMGDHGLFGKQNLYEFGGMHVPLVFFGPGIPKGKSDALVYLMDVFPTIAGIGNAPLPDKVEGKPLMPIITGKSQKVRQLMYTGYKNCMRSIRNENWKLIRYPLINHTQLFDLENDPHELNDLSGQSSKKGLIEKMIKLLTQEMTTYADDAPLVVDKPLKKDWNPTADK
ncbi:sulfatase-like hydrolase/transferase [Spirosoma endbachense]|uniref:Sulfatase-like hydrolase/transferase n=1 Tax=Spirosoma endbachense TaxID=2666025 RepID=A0A6P1W2F9_9BACT|nr:sulfatase-like hydrolase/transferase [Spirosoma endbachense]QHV98197.1 sulfatase-like hydrolase/transferase [Spirosoma endbachense]